ncbi:LLM class flavin-dependent oxidoreductase [Pseudochelatococcus sp. B33]
MASVRKEQIKLGALFHPTGNHIAAWLHEGAQIDAGTNFTHYKELAQTAEAAKFDLIFFADAQATRDGNLEALSRWPQYMVFFDPLTLLPALAAVTAHIGLVSTATTSYNEPYQIARKFASLDHISGGRAGWNIVTSGNASEAYNFGRDVHFDHTARYERAREFVEVVKGLLDSYADDAFLRDRESQRYFDPRKLHRLDHVGDYFRVRGPLNMARPPQGYPVLFQASASVTGTSLAAQHAEVVFTPLHSLAQGQKFYRELKNAAVGAGREEGDILIMPGLNVIVADTRREADEKIEYLQEKIHPAIGKELLSNVFGGIDLSDCDVDQPLPEKYISAEERRTNPRYAYLFERELTLKQMYEEYGIGRGQHVVKGTAVDVADEIQSWFENYAVDGFLIQPAVLPCELNEFARLVVPELQDRGLFRSAYTGTTLRENLGLKRPERQDFERRG